MSSATFTEYYEAKVGIEANSPCNNIDSGPAHAQLFSASVKVYVSSFYILRFKELQFLQLKNENSSHFIGLLKTLASVSQAKLYPELFLQAFVTSSKESDDDSA